MAAPGTPIYIPRISWHAIVFQADGGTGATLEDKQYSALAQCTLQPCLSNCVEESSLDDGSTAANEISRTVYLWHTLSLL